jgi:hypothetical protein
VLLSHVTTAKRPVITDFRPDLPQKMNAWVERSLAIEARSRFPSVIEQFAALKNALA